jgi:two-component system cell cycle response regulator DivK
VLVVDDDLDARTMYGMYLRSMGCTVYTAADGGGAITQAMALHPDVIVLDLAMPHVDGWAAAERLRRSPVTRAIPIVALTAIPGARDSARLSGCDAFMAKPCLPQMLWCEIRLLLGLDDTPTPVHN